MVASPYSAALRGLMLLALLSISLPLAAQDPFTEMGLRTGGGTNIPVPLRQAAADGVRAQNNPWALGWAYNADVFFSHYFCGKPTGYHFELGFRGFQLTEQRDSAPTFALPDTALRSTITMHFLQAGAYFKVRRMNFHRKVETCLMIGPKLNARFLSRVHTDGLGSGSFGSTPFRSVATVVPGLQASLWFRRPMGRKKSFFIIPGCDIYFTKNASTVFGQRFTSIYPFLNFGFTFWNNR